MDVVPCGEIIADHLLAVRADPLEKIDLEGVGPRIVTFVILHRSFSFSRASSFVRNGRSLGPGLRSIRLTACVAGV